jgi:F-type H+-transporting ATPase subunit beta
MPGRSVAVSDTIAGCKAILAGECDAWQESSLYMVGTLDEAREKEKAAGNAGKAKQPAEETKANGGSEAKAAAPKPAGATR